MIRQYRLERVQGMEILVCEVYRKHFLTQEEYEAFFRWKEQNPQLEPTVDDFRIYVKEQLSQEGVEDCLGLRYPIPVYDLLPALTLRGLIHDNRIASLQAEYVVSVLPTEVTSEVFKFYTVLDDIHWRDTIAHQIETYGSLFASEDD